jgi:PPOX class probable F420-dependent enzyme
MRVEEWARELLLESQLAHLATSTKLGKPQVIPICYVYDEDAFYSAIDEKPKRRDPTNLRRVLNILENSSVSLVVDQYEDDWSKLRYVTVKGFAKLIYVGAEYERALQMLRDKYVQYRRMRLEGRPVIKIKPISAFTWSSDSS